MFANRDAGLGWAARCVCGARLGAPEAVRSREPAWLRAGGRGFPLPFICSKPIVSQLTCGCLCNKPLSWLLEGLLSWAWRGPHFNTRGELGEPFPFPQVRPEARSGAPWAKGPGLNS